MQTMFTKAINCFKGKKISFEVATLDIGLKFDPRDPLKSKIFICPDFVQKLNQTADNIHFKYQVKEFCGGSFFPLPFCESRIVKILKNLSILHFIQ